MMDHLAPVRLAVLLSLSSASNQFVDEALRSSDPTSACRRRGRRSGLGAGHCVSAGGV